MTPFPVDTLPNIDAPKVSHDIPGNPTSCFYLVFY